MRARLKRVALVVPRCGPNVFGGAEALALQIARDLQGTYDVEILTTCAESYWTWENIFPEGLTEVNGIAVRRFPVDAPRDLKTFDRLSRRFRYRIAALTKEEQEQWLREQGPYSTALLQHLAKSEGTDAFVFVTYLYATTYFGLPLVRDRAILLPLAHDEWPLYFPVWRRFFADVRSMIFVTPEALDTVRLRFRDLGIGGEILTPTIAPARVPAGARAPAPGPYLLYLGRIDESKGVFELIELFQRHAAAHPESPWHLVLAGPHGTKPAGGERVHFVGAVDESEKRALIEGCEIFVMPSDHESLCIALLEAWSGARCSLVTGWNPVLVAQSRRSNGGLWYRDQRTFDAALSVLDERTRTILGAQGQQYVRRTYGRGNTAEVIARAIARLRA